MPNARPTLKEQNDLRRSLVKYLRSKPRRRPPSARELIGRAGDAVRPGRLRQILAGDER